MFITKQSHKTPSQQKKMIYDSQDSQQSQSQFFNEQKSLEKSFQNEKLSQIEMSRETSNQKLNKNYIKTNYYQNPKKDVFNLTYFKQKRNQMIYQQHSVNNNKINRLNPNITLQKIQEKMKKYLINPITTKSTGNKINNQKRIQLFRQTHHSRSNSHSSSVLLEENHRTQPSEFQHFQLKPLTLKKKLNLIKKRQNVLRQQLLMKQTNLRHEERSLQKSWRSLSLYQTKLQRINVIRQIHHKQRQQHQRQRNFYDKLILNEKIKLKQSIVGTRSNLSMSRLSIYEQKRKAADQIRRDTHLMTEEFKQKEKVENQRKKQTKECIMSCEKIWLDSVKQYKQEKKLVINQRKLQQISVEISSLQRQKKLNDTFYRQKQSNNPYRNRIKDKKMQIERKLKQYKKNLMLDLNQYMQTSSMQNQEDQLNNSKTNQTRQIRKRNKRLSVVSTEPDHLDVSTQTMKFRNSMMVSNRS